MKLIIGNKNYSSWSLRGWLMLAKNGLEFEVVQLPLFTKRFYEELSEISPALKVPVLIDQIQDGQIKSAQDTVIWDSLAICEYINEQYLSGSAWPQTIQDRAKARSIAAEMHSGFSALRNEMPMNCRAKRTLALSELALKDIARIDQIWSEQMSLNTNKIDGDGWLFGKWSIADCMFAPVVFRFVTYGVKVSPSAEQYMQRALASTEMQQWLADALTETDIVEEDEAGMPL
ncbi:glutathione S-transferase [Photobacterium frigidiphilum]|uniref:Glutathione S-transferase n=1 Tax=Photobacterium frigidiphilum TaxID=264736 RepID=A0A2T3JJH6_9GAMM|nr:glutathione S-transferase family protein [Photobacterium frigidiphilum]PSU49145.1 glutathione S-transferase [Photobacterium frigidiphilum]